jgi:hypothetical protein
MARLGCAAVEGANTHFRGTVRLVRLASVAEFRQYVDLSKNMGPGAYCPTIEPVSSSPLERPPIADQSIRWAKDTMIPSGPRTYAMRQMCSY